MTTARLVDTNQPDQRPPFSWRLTFLAVAIFAVVLFVAV